MLSSLCPAGNRLDDVPLRTMSTGLAPYHRSKTSVSGHSLTLSSSVGEGVDVVDERAFECVRQWTTIPGRMVHRVLYANGPALEGAKPCPVKIGRSLDPRGSKVAAGHSPGQDIVKFAVSK